MDYLFFDSQNSTDEVLKSIFAQLAGKAGKIVLKCTQIDPKSRFQTVEKLVVEAL